jgi:hypothetical protein
MRAMARAAFRNGESIRDVEAAVAVGVGGQEAGGGAMAATAVSAGRRRREEWRATARKKGRGTCKIDPDREISNQRGRVDRTRLTIVNILFR